LLSTCGGTRKPIANRFQVLMAAIGEIDDFLLRELSPHDVVDVVGRMRPRHQRQCLGPGQGRAFLLGKHRRFTPCIEQMHALFGFADLARVTGVHGEAKGAAVDL
jgi:hypothetical protein